jgi:hypothetical protein
MLMLRIIDSYDTQAKRTGSWVQIPPPASEFGLILSLFWLKNLASGVCEWGLKIEHTFTGKSAWVLYRRIASNSRFKLFQDTINLRAKTSLIAIETTTF